MADSALTKRVLGESLKDLMQKTPLAKISVGDITEHCSINRQTFYYHFKDKYDLVNWIYSSETLPYTTAFSDQAHWADGLAQLCIYLQQNKKFYINALSTPGQNSFEEYLTQFIHDLIYALILSLLDERSLPHTMRAEDIEFTADFYSLAFVALIMKWAQHGMKEDPVPYIARIKELVDGSMLRELEKYHDVRRPEK